MRSVKSRYPGYEDEIDAAVGSITGIDPANAYISQLRQEAMQDAAATNSGQDIAEDFINDHMDLLELVHPGFNSLPWDQQIALVTPGAEGNLRSRVSAYGADAAALEHTRVMVETGQIDATEGLLEALSISNNMFLEQMDIGIEDGTLADPEQIVRQLVANGNLGGEGQPGADINGAVQYLQGIIIAQRANYDAVLNDPRFTDADKERARAVIDDYIGTYNFYIETIMNGETGIAALTEHSINLRESTAYLALDDAFGGRLSFLTAVQSAVPPAMLEFVVNRNLGAMATSVAALVEAALNPEALATNPGFNEFFNSVGVNVPAGEAPSVNDIAQVAVNLSGGDEEEAAEILRGTLDLQLDKIRGTNGAVANPAQVAEALTFLFGTEGGFDFSIIPPDEHHDVYTLLTSPLVAQAAVTAGIDTQIAYENWAMNSFRVINSQTIADLNGNLQNPAFLETFDLVFNQATAQLEIRPKPGIEFNIGRGGLPDATQPGQMFYAAYVGLRDNVDRLNQSLGDINHLFTAGGGAMGGPEFTRLLPAQINAPVQFVNEPSGLAGLVPAATVGGDTPAMEPVGTATADEFGVTYQGGAPGTRDGQTAPTLTPRVPRMEPQVNPAQAQPNPNEPNERFGTTYPGGHPNTPDGQTAPQLNTNTQGGIFSRAQPNLGGLAGIGTPEGNLGVYTQGVAGVNQIGDDIQGALGAVGEQIDNAGRALLGPEGNPVDPTNPYAHMGWDEINTLNHNLLSPDERAQLTQRVTQLIAEGNLAGATKDLSTDQAKELSKTVAEAGKDDPSNYDYVNISRILLEPNPEIRQLRMDNHDNVIVTDSSEFLLGRLAPGHNDEHITNMAPELQTNLTRFFQNAPPEIAEGLGILSGYRSVERQRELWNEALRRYGSPEAARRWVAPPGSSQHNHGNAADLTWNGQSLAQAPAWVVQWLHANAEAYGLTFPLSNENWHIELIGARG